MLLLLEMGIENMSYSFRIEDIGRNVFSLLFRRVLDVRIIENFVLKILFIDCNFLFKLFYY